MGISSTEAHDLPPLGSLAQSARARELKHARNHLLFVGLVMIGISSFALCNARQQAHQLAVQQAQEQARQPGRGVNRAAVKAAEDRIWLFDIAVNLGLLALGVLFIVFGTMINRYPVPIMLIGLALYVLANLGVMLLYPQLIYHYLILKIVMVASFAMAIPSAIAYENGRARILDMEFGRE